MFLIITYIYIMDFSLSVSCFVFVQKRTRSNTFRCTLTRYSSNTWNLSIYSSRSQSFDEFKNLNWPLCSLFLYINNLFVVTSFMLLVGIRTFSMNSTHYFMKRN